MQTDTQKQEEKSILKVSVPLNMSFGQKLREWRRRRGLTQTELAAAVGVNVSYISNLERDFSANTKSGRPRASVDLCDRLARTLGVDKDEVRLEAGYAPVNFGAKPKNAAELIAALEKLGIEGILFDGDISDLSEDDYQEILDSVRMAVELTLRRANK